VDVVARWLIVVSFVAGCAPAIDGPAEHQRSIDRADGDRLGTQVAALPGVARAEVALRRPIADPLATAAPPPPGLSIVVIVDDHADRGAVERQTRALATSIAPGIDPVVVVDVGDPRPELARVGPFTVARASRTPLKVALALALATIAMLAAWIAVRGRRARPVA